MSLVRGENVILYVYDDGQWKPIICGRSCSIVTNAETIETSISGSGIWRTYEYAGMTWEMSIDAAVKFDVTNTLALSDMRAKQISREKILCRYERTDESANVYVDEGYGLITSVSDSGELDSVASFNVTIKGTGPITMIFTPTPIDPTAKVKRYEYEATGGEASITSATLIGKDILDVVIDGIGRSKIITAGTPVDQEVKYTTGTGTITFAIPLDSEMQVYILYQDI